jgi:hypothetical protein
MPTSSSTTVPNVDQLLTSAQRLAQASRDFNLSALAAYQHGLRTTADLLQSAAESGQASARLMRSQSRLAGDLAALYREMTRATPAGG